MMLRRALTAHGALRGVAATVILAGALALAGCLSPEEAGDAAAEDFETLMTDTPGVHGTESNVMPDPPSRTLVHLRLLIDPEASDDTIEKAVAKAGSFEAGHAGVELRTLILSMPAREPSDLPAEEARIEVGRLWSGSMSGVVDQLRAIRAIPGVIRYKESQMEEGTERTVSVAEADAARACEITAAVSEATGIEPREFLTAAVTVPDDGSMPPIRTKYINCP